MARIKIEQTKYKCADCENCVPYEKGFLNYEGKPILAGCIEQENNNELFLLSRSVNFDILPPLKRVGFLDTSV